MSTSTSASRRGRYAFIGIIALAGFVVGCGGAAATLAPPSPTPAPTSASGVPVFTVELTGSVEKTFKSDPTAVTAACTTPATGPWTILYSGGSPSIQLDLRVYQGAATPAGSKDFDLEVDAGDGGFFPMPLSGRAQGDHGATGTISVARAGSDWSIDVAGKPFNRDGTTPPSLTLHLTCPPA
jgi:hypothetical protein